MATDMRGDMTIGVCQIRHLFEIGIYALVGDYRRHHAVQHYFRGIAVYPLGGVEHQAMV